MFFREFELPTEPKFNDLTVSILDFGAVADNETDASRAINAAISHVSENGGGKVVVPAGVYYSKPITMQSNVNLYLEKGVRINFSDKWNDVMPAVFTRVEGIRCYSLRPLIYGVNLENVAITGEGVLNGNGRRWWDNYVQKGKVGSTFKSASANLTEMAAAGVPIEERVFDDENSLLRPYFLQILYSKNIWIEGVRFINSPFWCLCPTFSENVIIRNVSFLSPKGSYNTDSVDIDSCKNVLVEGVRVDCSSDDGVVIKSGRDIDGRLADSPSENVLVRNCEFHCSGCAVAVGSETSGGIRNVYMHDITCDECSAVVSLKTAPTRGNVIEDIVIENVKSNRSIGGVSISTHYCVSDSEKPDFTNMPKVRRVFYKNIDIDLCWHGMSVRGFEGHQLEDIHLENIKIGCIESTLRIEHVDGIHIDGLNVYMDHENTFDWRTVGHRGLEE